MPERRFQPSKRGLAALGRGIAWDYIGLVHKHPLYDPERCPGGVINLMGAHNALMSDWMKEYIKIDAQHSCSADGLAYGSPSGSEGLRISAAGFFNRFFNPCTPIDASHVIATNGVTSAIDLLTLAVCEPGDAILYPAPNFYMLDFDIGIRNQIACVPVAVERIVEGDPFAATETAARGLELAFEQAIEKTQATGARCRALFLCNPANPQARCYPPPTLQRLADLCTRRGIHLIVDEIYALSNFSGGSESFSSVLSVPDASTAELQNIHCLYGTSKDFSLGGLRMGFIVTRNTELKRVVDKLSMLDWISNYSDLFVTRLFSRLDLVQDYISTNQKRLAASYACTSDALEQHRIPFLPSTSALFIFVDLSAWLRFFPEPEAAGSKEAAASKSRELQLWEALVDGGVALNPGEFAQYEKPGWFRLVFSEDLPATLIAISRLRTILDKLEISTSPAAAGECDTRGMAKAVSFDETSLAIASGKDWPGTQDEPGSSESRSINRLFRRIIICNKD